MESSTCLLCLYIARVSESIFVVSGSAEATTVSTTAVSAAATESVGTADATADESFCPSPAWLRPKKGMDGSAIINMKADSRMNITVFVLIAMQGANLRK